MSENISRKPARRIIAIAALAVAASGLAPRAQAQNSCPQNNCQGASVNVTDPPESMSQAMGITLSHGLDTHPMQEGVLQTKIAPSYLTWSGNSGNHMDGWAVSASASYGLSKHWGIGLLTGYAQVSGNRAFDVYQDPGNMGGLVKIPGMTNPWTWGTGKGEGVVVAASAIWDHWTGEGFRLPCYAGLGYIHATESADSSAFQVRRSAEINSPAFLFGVIPSWNMWKVFRGAAFLMFSGPIENGTGTIETYDGKTHSTFNLASNEGFLLPILGVELTYKPWGVGASYNFGIEGASAYGLQWTHRWGDSAKNKP